MKHHRLRIALSLCAALLVAPLAACASPMTDLTVRTDSGADMSADMSAGMTADGGAGVTSEEMASDPTAAGRSIIREGSLSVTADDPAEATERATDIAEGLDGYVESQSIDRGDGGASSAYLQIRVPSDRLDDAFEQLAELGEVTSQSRSATDVTEQHVDLQARVEALEVSVERLQKLMSGAATTGELIEAESALTQRQQELDGLRAQLASLEGLVDEATISLSISAERVLPGDGPDNFWDGLVLGWESIVTAAAGTLVVLGVLLPWIIVAGIVAFAIVLIVRRTRQARRARRSAPTGTDAAGGTNPAKTTDPA